MDVVSTSSCSQTPTNVPIRTFEGAQKVAVVCMQVLNVPDPAHGPVPVMLTFDYALNQNMLLGARVGYEFLTVPVGAGSPLLVNSPVTCTVAERPVRVVRNEPQTFGGILRFRLLADRDQ